MYSQPAGVSPMHIVDASGQVIDLIPLEKRTDHYMYFYNWNDYTDKTSRRITRLEAAVTSRNATRRVILYAWCK